MVDEAIAHLEASAKLSPNDPMVNSSLGYLYASSHQPEKARAILARLQAKNKPFRFPAYYSVSLHLSLGEADQAFAKLEKACNQRSPWVIYVNVDPMFDCIRQDPRFTNLLQTMGISTR
jgi:tetratricopeptide (TPR) repeat protein